MNVPGDGPPRVPDLPERERLLDAVNAAYAVLRADREAWRAERKEREAWDGTLIDGVQS